VNADNAADAHRDASFLPGFPAFANELAGTLAVHSQYVLHGNVRDQFLMVPPGRSPLPVPMLKLLWEALQPSGYQALVCYDPVDGVTVYPPEDNAARRAAESVLGSRVIGRRPPLEKLRAHLAKVVGVPEQPPLDSETPVQSQQQQPDQSAQPVPKVEPKARVAFVIDYAARITRVPGQLDPVERDFFLYCQKLAFTARPAHRSGPRPGPLYNPIIWVVEGERDLPAWLTAGVEPIRTIAVSMPTLDERSQLARVLQPMFPPSREAPEQALNDPVDEFAKRTDGMTLKAMMEITKLAKDRGMGLDRISDATRIYKLGVEDNLWRRGSVRDQIIKGEKMIYEKIKGQDRAVGKTLDILKRAALGLSGAQATSSGSRPRGVLFFAGPTGVGKTEMAKQVAEILFGDADAYLRFDMSEFAAEQAADRLIGAPPGYVGFEAGGELTGAVRRQPFQVVLFDEIEKAHPLVLDKFLQILEDGRLTDGQGITTHFSECVLIFTSNLGIITTNRETGRRERIVEPGVPYPELEARIKAAIRDHFTTQIGRPELLNRLGDNIVVFDFISARIAQQIFGIQVRNVVAKVHSELGIRLEITDQARRQLCEACTTDLENGGRGIGNLLESNLINPLARVLFERDCGPSTRVVITALHQGDNESGPVLEAGLSVGDVA
jgi:Cdc48 subfamily AAA family protein/ClpA/ClpB-like protein